MRLSLLIFVAVIHISAGIQKGGKKQTGPCTLRANEAARQSKCTKNGYFEVKQCRADYCVCVDPRTGEEAPDTRTVSKATDPVCGACHLAVAKSLASIGSSNLPQCQPNSGKYQSKQCQNEKNCRCVNEETGDSTEPNQDPGPSWQLSCPAVDQRMAASLDSKPLSTDKAGDTAVGMEIDQAPVADPICRQPRDSGRSCGNGRASSVQWYFDPETFECLAFNFKGCSGNGNRFQSPSECWSRCKLADFGSCAGLKSPAKNQKGENILCYQNGMEAQKCPTGYICTMLAFFGVCCDEKAQEIYRRNYRPRCADGRQAKQMESGGVPMTLIGKSCRDEFCPPKTVCRAQEIFAHCCNN